MLCVLWSSAWHPNHRSGALLASSATISVPTANPRWPLLCTAAWAQRPPVADRVSGPTHIHFPPVLLFLAPGLQRFAGWSTCCYRSSLRSCFSPILHRAATSSTAQLSKAAAAVPGGRQPVTEAHVSLLLSHGFLTRHTGGLDGYLFSMPNAGAAVRSVAGALKQECRAVLGSRNAGAACLVVMVLRCACCDGQLRCREECRGAACLVVMGWQQPRHGGTANRAWHASTECCRLLWHIPNASPLCGVQNAARPLLLPVPPPLRSRPRRNPVLAAAPPPARAA